MNRITFYLAQIDVKDSLVPDLQKTSLSRNELTLLFSAVGVVTLLVIIWAIFIRKRPDDSSRRYSYPSRDSDKDNTSESGAKASRRSRRRRKRRSLNPTLAETGGLPPIRADGYFEDPP
jgi:hypothetical protein